MKKLLSVVLALVMVLSTASMLIPTAFATESGEPSQAATRPEGSWVYYEQNFDDEALAALEDAALAEKLGWEALDTTQTVKVEDGKLRYVSQYFKANGTTAAGTYTTALPATIDDRILGNVTVIEYDLTYQRRAASTENDVSVNGGTKIVKADGQDAAQYVSINMGDTKTGLIYATRFTAQGEINTRAIRGDGKTSLGGSMKLTTADSVVLVNDVPGLETPETVEYDGKKAGSHPVACMGMDYHVKAVLDPVAGMYYLMVNDVLVSKISDQENYSGSLRMLIENITSGFELALDSSVDVLLDNIQIYGYNATPALVISEIATNGYGVDAAGEIKTGGYQWVEVYNPTPVPVNVYDYALHVNNMPTKATSKFGQNADVVNGRGSALGYLRAGEQTFTLAEGTSTFTNPALEDGVLEAGETAILLLPETQHAAGKALDASKIVRAFEKMGMPADTQLFVCDNYNEYPLVLSAEGVMTVGLMKVDQAGTENAVGKYVGQDDSFLSCLESYLLVSTEDEKAETLYEGFGNYVGAVTNGAVSSSKKTLEISYWSWGVDGSTSKMGYMNCNGNQSREGIDGSAVYATPGFVPEICRPAMSIEVYDMNGENPQIMYGTFMGEWALEDPTVEGYEFCGYYIEGNDFLVDSVYMSANGIKVYPIYERVAPIFVGAQTSEVTDGTYSVRLLGGINRQNVESVGFKYSYTYTDAVGVSKTVEEQVYECKYVYTSVIANGQEIFASDYDCEYFFALHINNIPETVTDIDFKVTAFVVEDKFNTEPVCDLEQEVEILLPATESDT